jgi:glycosyltransferase 2 family protein
LSYLALTGYDALALRHLRIKVPYRLTALASFASYAFSFTLGFPLVTGGAVRYWIYGPVGLSAGKVASLTIVAGITFWLGMGLVVGSGFLSASDPVAGIDHFHPLVNRLIGAGVVGAVIGYLAWISRMRWRDAAVVGDFKLPGPLLTLGQMALGVIDICSASAALYVLLPKAERFGFPTFATLYSFAAMLGIASHAPGGLGVFEATILQGVGGNEDAVLASLLLFRGIYYAVPFIAAMAMLGGVEAARRWRSLREAMSAASDD